METKKNGFIAGEMLTVRGLTGRKSQRFFCNACKSSFTGKGHNVRTKVSDDFKRRVVTEYVTTKASLGDLSKRTGVSKTSIVRWMEETACCTQDFYEFGFDNPSGYIQVDGKEVKIKGRRRTILIATDSKTHKPVCYGVYDSENKKNARDFLIRVKELYGAPVVGITSDFGRGKCFVAVIREIFPSARHQVCIVHFLRYLWMFLPRTKRSKYFWRNRVLKAMITAIVKAESRSESLEMLEVLLKRKAFFMASYHKRFLRSIEKNYEALTAHFDDPELDKTSNSIENINRQLERKLKTTDGFKSERSFRAFLKLWFVFRYSKYVIQPQLK